MYWSLPGSSANGIFQAKDTAVCCHFFLQGIFPTRGSKDKSPLSPALAGEFFTTVPPGKPIDLGGAAEFTSNSLQLMLLLLVPGPHGENYCPQERDKMDVPSESIWHSIIGHIRLKWLLNKCVVLNAFFTQPAEI